ncbi:terminase [Staphylococcus pseudintermedius]|uniref:Terminase n=1 Tax=Staphylococcus pseudintermedius TaxID=283734 RepID=A0A8H9EQK0_STAPS|nr:terminase [Staphylococcus pseudintermedius]EGQ0318546.1 terminase [Staphylococcus pseudintermedius]EGQ1283893.1 terminase [Staphylococcus pseudintermedius]EGQ2839682.1 terminase [Staphylococcus pseudintermedius]EGQ3464040.1 terminase [Staphylococcus pseudintermedius]EGQ4003746.1 terminase [Staphylococcus pseudintermedius]
MEKNFYARINAIIKDFERGVRKAQRLAKTSIPNEIETEIKANTSKFQRALTRAKAMAQKWREHTVEIDGDASPLKRVIATTKAILKTFRKHTIKIDYDVRKTELLKAKLADVWHAGGRALDDFSSKIDHLATRIRSFGTVFAQQIKGVLIASFQALIPIISGLVPALFAVLNAVGVLGGGALGLAGAFSVAGLGAVAFGAMAISAIKMVNDGTLAVTKEVEAFNDATSKLKDTWAGIIRQNQAQIFNAVAAGIRGVNSGLSKMKPFLSGVANLIESNARKFEDWINKSNTAKAAFKALNTVGVQIFGDLLNAAGRFGDGLVNIFTQFMPLFKWVSQGLKNMSADFQSWANSVSGQNAIKSFIEYTKENLPKIGKIFGNVFKGIGNLMIAFGQNSAGIFDWLVKMTDKFREWSETVGKSEGFKKFVNYVEKNGPTIMKLIGDIVRVLVAFGTAMAPIASALLNLIGRIADFVASLFEAHPNVARFFGILTILGGAFWALLAPIIFVSTILTNVFGKSLFDVIKYIVKFVRVSTLLKGAFDLLKGAVKLLLNPIGNLMKLLPILGGALASITLPVWIVIGAVLALVGIIVYLWNTNEDFRKAVIKAWDEIRQKIGEAIDGVKKWLSDLWSKTQETLQPIMPLLQQLGTIANQVLGVVFISLINGLMVALQGLWTLIQIVFSAIGTFISVTVQFLVGIFTTFIQFITGDFSGAWQTLKQTIFNVGLEILAHIQNTWNIIYNFLLDTYNRITGQTATSWSQVWQTIQNFAIAIWNVVSNWFQRVASTVQQKMLEALAYVVGTGAQWVASIRQAMTNFKNAVVQKFWEVVEACRKGMQDALNAVRSFIGQFVQAGVDLVAGLISGIVQKAGDLAKTAWNAAKSALNAAKSALDSHSPSRKFMQLGRDSMTGLGMGIEQYAAKAAKASRNAALGIMSAFNAKLSPSFDGAGLIDSVVGDINGFIDDDVRHSIEENNRPIVNLHVENDVDAEFLRTYIKDMDSKEYYT